MALWRSEFVLRPLFGVVAALLLSMEATATSLVRESDVPEGITVVYAEDLMPLALAYPDLIIIDSRSESDRERGYIEDSISLPSDQTSCETLAKFSKRLDRPLLFYCNGVRCGRSRQAVQIAKNCGYTRLYWFKGGFEEWQEKHFPVFKPE